MYLGVQSSGVQGALSECAWEEFRPHVDLGRAVTVELGDSGPKLLVSKISVWIDSKQGPFQQYM